MKIILAFLLLVCCAYASDVVVLTEADYDAHLKENPNTLVEFYAPWCGHCKSLAPEWEKLATSLKGKVPIAKVDCTAEQSVCSKEGVQGYPTIKFFKNGNAVPYNGQRTAAVIEQWVVKKLGDAYTTVTSKDQLEELLKQHVVLGHFSSKDSESFKDFADAASANEDITFAAVFDSSLVSDFKDGSVKTLTPGQEPLAFDGSSSLTSWILEYGFPLVDKLGQKAFERLGQLKKKYFVLLFAPQVEPKESVKVLETIAAAYRKDLGFLWDLGEQYAQHASRLGISGTEFPALVGMDEKEKFFPLTKEFTAENVKAFLDSLLAGQVQPHLQSEPVPESNDGPVTVVVGRNYDEVVKNSANDVFLEVYAPWCGHCKQLAPTWEELGQKFKGKVTIAKIDGTANDVPLQIQGYPTLLFFKAGSKDTPIPYEGDRTLDDLVQFVEKQTAGAGKDEL